MSTVRALLGSTANTNSGTKTNTSTPAVGDLVVIIAGNTGNVATPTVSDNNADGLGAYTMVASARKAASADRVTVWVRNALVGSATSTTWQQVPGASTGGFILIFALSGMTATGALAVRQIAVQEDQTAGGTPAPTFASAALGINTLLGVIFNATNPATMTKPASFDTERVDSGYTVPDTGVEIVTDDTGNTDTTVTWGSTSASDWCSIIVEFNAGSLHNVNATGETDSATAFRRRKSRAIGAVQETNTASPITFHGRKSAAIGQAFETDTLPVSPVSAADKPQWAANVDFTTYEPLIGRTYDAIREYVGLEDVPGGPSYRDVGTRRRLFSVKCYSPDGMIQYYVAGPQVTASSLTWSAGQATLNFATPIHARLNKFVTLAGFTPSGWNGTWQVTQSGTNQLKLAIGNNFGPVTVLGTASANGITMGAWDAEIDAIAAWMAPQPAMDLVLHHEPEHLPGSFTEFPGDAGTTPSDPKPEFKAANEYFWARLQAGGVNPDIVKFGFCLMAVTERNGNADKWLSTSHRFLALDGYSGSASVFFDDIFSGADTFCAAHSLDFYVWETNVNITTPTGDADEKAFWEALPAQAEAMNCTEVSLWIGTTQTMNPTTEPLKFAGYTDAGLSAYFTDVPTGSSGDVFTPTKSRAIGQAAETDTSQSWVGQHGVGHFINIGQTNEADLAQGILGTLPHPAVVELEVVIPKFRRRVQLPPVAWVVGGIPCPVEQGWSANAVADGGMDRFTGAIPESIVLANPLKFVQGARVTGFVGSQQVVYDGTLTGNPVMRQGVAMLEAAGFKTRAELASGRLLFQSRDYSSFQDGGEPPMNFTPFTEEIEGEVRPAALRWHLIKDFDYQTDDAYPLAAWYSGALVTRVAGDIARSDDVSDCALRVQSFTGPEGARTLLHDYSLSSGGPTSFDLDIADPENGVVFNVRFSADNTVAAHRYIRVRNLRVNGIADGDEMATSEVVAAIGQLLGYETRLHIDSSSVNALPFDLTTGTWSQEGLSYMALLDDWRWLVLEDRGAGPILDYGPWDRVWYVQRAENAVPDLRPLPLYDSVVVRYKAANGTLQQVEATAEVPGVSNVWYEDLTDAQPDDTLASAVAASLIAKLSVPRYAGSLTITGAMQSSGQGNAYEVRPGDLVDVSDWVPAGHVRQRIVEVQYQHDSVTLGVEAPVTADGVIATFALERARRRKGKAFAGATG